MIGVELLFTDDTRGRGVRLLEGMQATALAYGFKPRATTRYEGSQPWLMAWGCGHPVRNAWFLEHVRRGGIAIAWDMGYWNAGRGQDVLGMNRVTVNALHPQRYVMRRNWPAQRLVDYPVATGERWKRDGRIVLAGLGHKSLLQLGLREGEWERKRLAEIRAAYPNTEVIHRPKPGLSYANLGIPADDTTPIEKLLAGASLAVCRHSNVAIDAIRWGIPAACDDGAAAAVASNKLRARRPLGEAKRAQFLTNLAHFQWSIAECWNGTPWEFLRGLLCD